MSGGRAGARSQVPMTTFWRRPPRRPGWPRFREDEPAPGRLSAPELHDPFFSIRKLVTTHFYRRLTMSQKSRSIWTFVITSVALFMASLDNLVVTMALPSIREHRHASLEGLQWTVNAYTLTFAVLLLTGATLGERYGRRRMFVIGLGLFTMGSAAAALASGIGELVAARAVQGVGAAILVPLTLTLLSAAVPPARRGLALGAWGAVGGLAIAIGPLVGGAGVGGASWEWVFWLNLPLGLGLPARAGARPARGYGPAGRPGPRRRVPHHQCRVAADVLRDVRLDLPAGPVPAGRPGLQPAGGRDPHAPVDRHAGAHRPDRGHAVGPDRRQAATGDRAGPASDRPRLAGRGQQPDRGLRPAGAPVRGLRCGDVAVLRSGRQRRARLGAARGGGHRLRCQQRDPRTGRGVRHRGARCGVLGARRVRQRRLVRLPPVLGGPGWRPLRGPPPPGRPGPS